MARVKGKTTMRVKGKIMSSNSNGKSKDKPQGKPLYRSKAKLNTHIKNERPS